MTKKIRHTVTSFEMEHGLMNEPGVFENFPFNHRFAGVKFSNLDGETNYDRHCKGEIHMHSSVPNRVDGMTQCYHQLLGEAESAVVEVYVDDENYIVIKEIVQAPENDDLAKKAAEIRRMMEQSENK